MLAIKRCVGCPGQSHSTDGPTLCDNPLEDCHKFCPTDSPHQFTLTIGPIKTSHQVMCPGRNGCGYIFPYEPLPYNSPVYCVLCGNVFIVRGIK